MSQLGTRNANNKASIQKHYETRVRRKFPIGSVFGRLTVTGYEHIRNGWSVRCACSCGGDRLVRYPNQMRRGLVKSCGCLVKEIAGNTAKTIKHFKLPTGEASFNQFYRTYVYNSSARGLEFGLSSDQFRHIVVKRCAYCGDFPKDARCKSQRKFYNGGFVANGIDRIDPSKGYAIGNVVPCCKTCNYAKRGMSVSEFKSWLLRAADHVRSAP